MTWCLVRPPGHAGSQNGLWLSRPAYVQREEVALFDGATWAQGGSRTRPPTRALLARQIEGGPATLQPTLRRRHGAPHLPLVPAMFTGGTSEFDLCVRRPVPKLARSRPTATETAVLLSLFSARSKPVHQSPEPGQIRRDGPADTGRHSVGGMTRFSRSRPTLPIDAPTRYEMGMAWRALRLNDLPHERSHRRRSMGRVGWLLRQRRRTGHRPWFDDPGPGSICRCRHLPWLKGHEGRRVHEC